jgi:hypothetical protein
LLAAVVEVEVVTQAALAVLVEAEQEHLFVGRLLLFLVLLIL